MFYLFIYFAKPDSIIDNKTIKSQPLFSGSQSSANDNFLDFGNSLMNGIGGVDASTKDDDDPCSPWRDHNYSLLRVFECLGFSGSVHSITQRLLESCHLTGPNGTNVYGRGAMGSSGGSSGLGISDHPKGASKSINDLVQGGSSNFVSNTSGSAAQVTSSSIFNSVPINNLALAFVVFHRNEIFQLNRLYNHELRMFQELNDELVAMRKETTEIRTILNSLTAELEAIRVSLGFFLFCLNLIH